MTQQLDEAESVFAAARPRLFGIAYRMTGSVADAEDLVQEVWLRWQLADRAAVLNPEAYLATAITRLAINESQTARARRETYVGPWLPEPVDTSADPQVGAERGAVLELAVLMLLEKLTPTERAAYVLREAFDYPYREIAEIVQTSEVATRQLVSRARKHLADERRVPVERADQRRLLEAFVAAAQAGDLAALEQLFAQDVVSYSDSNGGIRAAGRPLFGAASLAKIISGWAPSFWAGAEASFVEANGLTAVRLRKADGTYAVITVTASAEGIDQVLWLVNPEKLAAFQ
ncbi:RNA polymerase sigma-70 factor, ECF subfamily [Lentzea albidocapillata subsp. violacea]|uniref:RNA polymerase sigma-70 factor, ECF subfamily n=1 Tax=Lentzea albidocapillata subsp. violacea TaxID=128104 RepID=A0A1G9XFH5_9PSEU|nr:RNA polymerase sigma-70 factor [Lentzea albidocapillata]SDM95015.1 RNA polymerase sigma-70 factor, ECF subfamily [Lentzea albidocapillata subsp. violacea]